MGRKAAAVGVAVAAGTTNKFTRKLGPMCLLAILLLLFSRLAASQIVTSLPGFDGELPFTLETGYVGAGESNESQLFYYFVESQRSPALDPLMVWLTGGPGCSSITALLFESGPVSFNYQNYSGGLPSLHLNPFAWTKTLNIIYLDWPVGSGFSYSTTQENYYQDDLKAAWQSYEFIKNWLIEHPQFMTNQLYIGGDSYGGKAAPLIVQNILDGNQDDSDLFLNLKGYVIGNPKTDNFIDVNARVAQAHRMVLIPDELYESAKANCDGNYVNINASNVECVTDLNAILESLAGINSLHVLEPCCQVASPRSCGANLGGRYLEEDPSDDPEDFLVSRLNSALWCRGYQQIFADIWVNHKAVRDAIHVREGTKGAWARCNVSGLAYYQNVPSVVGYHQNFTKQNLRALVYSGDHDMSIPHIGTLNWIHMLNLSTDEYWRAWFVDGQVAGYTETLTSNEYTLQYATVKGAGHVAPESKSKECYAMINRFFAYYPL